MEEKYALIRDAIRNRQPVRACHRGVWLTLSLVAPAVPVADTEMDVVELTATGGAYDRTAGAPCRHLFEPDDVNWQGNARRAPLNRGSLIERKAPCPETATPWLAPPTFERDGYTMGRAA